MTHVTVRQRYSPCQVEVESQENNQQVVDAAVYDYLGVFRTLSSPPSRCDIPWRQKLESVLWIASAAFIVYYGDLRTNFILLIATDTRINRLCFNLGLCCSMLNLAILLYVVYQLRYVEKPEDRLAVVAQATVPAATLIGVTAFTLFSYALWPIWNFLTIPMLFTLFMALVVVVPHLAPSSARARLDMDAVRGIYMGSSE